MTKSAKTNNLRRRRKSASETAKSEKTKNEDRISNSGLSTCEKSNTLALHSGCLGKAFVAVFVTVSLLLLVAGLSKYYPALDANATKYDSSTLFEIERRHDLSLEDFVYKYDGQR